MTVCAAEALTLTVPGSGEVSALWCRPRRAHAVLVLAHGAGAGMRHPFMDAIATGLAAREVATLRFQFPYMEAGRRRPDPSPTAMRTVRAALTAARRRAAGMPLYAGGKSFGGRMTSAAAAAGMDHVAGLVLLGFPLHRPGHIDRARATHLAEVRLPMLFVQGSRDRLADLATMAAVVNGLGPRASLHVVREADHGFVVPRRSGIDPEAPLAEVCGVVAEWIGRQ